MAQLSFFASKYGEPPRRQPDLDFVRKTLNWRLRTVRNAEILPWSVPETESLEKHLPELASLLPESEAAEFIEEFASELARLRTPR
jgi:hypothetical protein